MSSCPGDAASHLPSDMNFGCSLLVSFGFANHMDSSNLVGSFFFDPFLRDLKGRMLDSLLL